MRFRPSSTEEGIMLAFSAPRLSAGCEAECTSLLAPAFSVLLSLLEVNLVGRTWVKQGGGTI